MLGVPEVNSMSKDWSLSASRESSIASLYSLLGSLELCRMDRNPAGSKPGWVSRPKLRVLICSIAKPANLIAIYSGGLYMPRVYTKALSAGAVCLGELRRLYTIRNLVDTSSLVPRMLCISPYARL